MACRHIAFRCTYALPCHTPQPNLIQTPKQPPGVPDSGWGVKFPHLVGRRLGPCLRRPHPADNDSSVVLGPTASHARIPALRHCQPDLYSALPHLCAAGGVSLDPHPHPHPRSAFSVSFSFSFSFSPLLTIYPQCRLSSLCTTHSGSGELSDATSFNALINAGFEKRTGCLQKVDPAEKAKCCSVYDGYSPQKGHPRSPTPPPRCQRYPADVTFGCTQDLPS